MKQCLAAHLECLNADTICLSNSCTGPRSTNCTGEEKIMNRNNFVFWGVPTSSSFAHCRKHSHPLWGHGQRILSATLYRSFPHLDPWQQDQAQWKSYCPRWEAHCWAFQQSSVNGVVWGFYECLLFASARLLWGPHGAPARLTPLTTRVWAQVYGQPCRLPRLRDYQWRSLPCQTNSHSPTQYVRKTEFSYPSRLQLNQHVGAAQGRAGRTAAHQERKSEREILQEIPLTFPCTAGGLTEPEAACWPRCQAWQFKTTTRIPLLYFFFVFLEERSFQDHSNCYLIRSTPMLSKSRSDSMLFLILFSHYLCVRSKSIFYLYPDCFQ